MGKEIDWLKIKPLATDYNLQPSRGIDAGELNFGMDKIKQSKQQQ